MAKKRSRNPEYDFLTQADELAAEGKKTAAKAVHRREHNRPILAEGEGGPVLNMMSGEEYKKRTGGAVVTDFLSGAIELVDEIMRPKKKSSE